MTAGIEESTEEKKESFDDLDEKKSFFKRRKAKNFIISLETAEEQLAGWLDYYSLDPERLSDDEAEAADAICQRLIIYTRQGKLTFSDDGSCSHNLKEKKDVKRQVIYKPLKGIAKTQDKRGKKNESPEAARVRRIYSMMASLCNLPIKELLNFEAVDMSIVECIGFLLLIV